MKESKKVLILGCNGQDGKVFNNLLKKGELENSDDYEFFLSDHKNKFLFPERFVRCDVTNEHIVWSLISAIKPDFIINFSGANEKNSSSLKNMYDVNVFGTLNIVQAIKDLNLKNTSLITCGSIYRNLRNTFYAKSKKAASDIVDQFKFEGFKSNNITLCQHESEFRKDGYLFPKIIKTILNRLEDPLAPPSSIDNFSDVLNVALAEDVIKEIWSRVVVGQSPNDITIISQDQMDVMQIILIAINIIFKGIKYDVDLSCNDIKLNGKTLFYSPKFYKKTPKEDRLMFFESYDENSDFLVLDRPVTSIVEKLCDGYRR